MKDEFITKPFSSVEVIGWGERHCPVTEFSRRTKSGPS
jgi:hypothetical protein